MIPYKDENRLPGVPYITGGLIAVNVLVFILEWLSPGELKQTAWQYGVTPHALRELLQSWSPGTVKSLMTSLFVHGDLVHLAGNMFFLWIFGNNIEHILGRGRYFVFYILSGIAASYAYTISDPGGTIPMIGASGAVSGILGAYLLLFPKERIHIFVFIIFYMQIFTLPAYVVIGLWGVLQLIYSIATFNTFAHGGVAWIAHLGGFLFGLITCRVWRRAEARS